MKKVLLHICCGVCAFYCIERLRADGYCVEGFFYNPNIYPEEEYLKRRFAAYEVCNLLSMKLSEGMYEPKLWFNQCQDYKDSKEGEKRCNICYAMRLSVVCKTAKALGFDFFTTTLTVSPHKNSSVIAKIGRELDVSGFLAIDFKKSDGFKKTLEFAKKHNLYRQNYCGCVYSIRPQT